MELSVKNLLESAFEKANLDLNEVFEQKILEYGWSRRKVCKILAIEDSTLEGILNGTAKQPSLSSVLKISQFLELPINDIITYILRTQDSDNIASITKAQKATFIAQNFDLKKLSKIRFFENTDDIDYIVNRLLSFFGFDSIYEFENAISIPLFSRSKRKFTDKMKDFWVKSAYSYFKDINNPNEYSRDNLKELIVKIKPYCQDVNNGLYIVCRALYNAGVTIIVQEQLVTTQIRGATFIINGKPCIVLTDLFKNYTTLWFTLIHELHHVLFDFDKIESTTYHLTGDADLFLIEEKADEFSREYFFGFEQYKYVENNIHNPYVVEKLAKELEIHSSFVYAAYRYFQKETTGKNFYGAFTQYFPDYSQAIADLNPINWTESTIPEKAIKIKATYELT